MRSIVIKAGLIGLGMPLFTVGCGGTEFTSAEPQRSATQEDDATVGPNNPGGINPAGSPGANGSDQGVVVGANGIDPSRIIDGEVIVEQNSGDTGFDGAVVPTTEELALACADATALMRKSQALLFPKPATYCDWGQNGNLPFDEDNQLVITARREQSVILDIPANALLCSLSFDFPEQNMRYDDEIMLLLDDVVLAASQRYDSPNELEVKDGLLLYDWGNLINKAYPINNRDPYFIDADCSADQCAIPPTETTGKMKLAIKDETVRKVTTRLGGARFEMAKDNPETVSPMAVRFVTTGDNDEFKDCMHEDVNFAVSMTYITP